MSSKNLQTRVKDFVEAHSLETTPEIRTLDLVSEVGEFAKEILKGNEYGTVELSKTENMQQELGDILFSVTCIANSLGISLDQALDDVLMKYKNRIQQTGDTGSGR